MPDESGSPEALLACREKYRCLEENIPGMVFLFALHTDGSYSFPYVNSLSSKLVGIDPQDLMCDASLLTKIIHPDDIDKFETSVKHSAETLQPWREELRHIVNDEIRWYDCISRPELQTNGDIVWNGIILEITDRKHIEKELELFQHAIEKSKEAVFWLESSGKFNYVNEQAYRSLGYTREELMEMHLWDIDPDFPVEVWADSWKLDAELGHRTFETIHRKKNGLIFPVEVSTSHITFGTNEFHVAYVRDITNRKKAEEALRASEEKYRSVVDNIEMSIVLIDADMKVQSVNRYTKALFPDINFETSPLCYGSFNYPPRENICEYCASIQTLKDGKVHETVTETPTENGIRNFRLISSPIKDDSGDITGVVEIAEDVTEKKRIEDEKRELESKLLQSQKMEALGTMAGGISHDFNNILAIISGYTEMAMDGVSIESNTNEKLQKVLKAASRAKDLVRQILSYSRQDEQELQAIYPHIIVRETLKLLRATIPATIEIQQDRVMECGTILADPTQFHQILMNLTVNAVHAMREKGLLSITLEATTLDEHDLKLRPDMTPGLYAKLTVADTGAGIPPDVADRIFDPFFTTKEVDEGTGMGLSVVQGVVMSHNGMIKVESKQGQGSHFHVYFPIIETKKVKLVESIEPLPRGTESILFVDDELDLTELSRQILEGLGYKVTAFNDSVEALAFFQSRPDEFDLLITDQTMPNLSGLELMDKVLKTRPTLPIILCTGYSSKVSLDNIHEYKFQRLIMKPFTRNVFAKTVREVIDTYGEDQGSEKN